MVSLLDRFEGRPRLVMHHFMWTFIADGLLDELHLFMYPVTRGAGQRISPDDTPRKWSLSRSLTYDNGVIYLVYQVSTS